MDRPLFVAQWSDVLAIGAIHSAVDPPVSCVS